MFNCHTFIVSNGNVYLPHRDLVELVYSRLMHPEKVTDVAELGGCREHIQGDGHSTIKLHSWPNRLWVWAIAKATDSHRGGGGVLRQLTVGEEPGRRARPGARGGVR